MSAQAAARIRAAVRAVPPGRVASYGLIADLAGLPGRSRLVGHVLGRSGAGPDAALPWHRVVRADGRIAFPPGSPAFAEQARRLRAEGVRVERGRVDLARFRLDLDAVLWGPAGLS